MPKDAILQKIILYKAHDSPTCEHPSYSKTLNLVRKGFFWNGLKKDVLWSFENAYPANKELKLKVHGKDSFSLGKETIDLRYIEQIADSEQTAALGQLLKYAREHLLDNKRSLSQVISLLEKTLDEKGLAENTVIILMGDNGYFLGERQLAGKWLMYKPSLRVPLIVFDPRKEGGTRNSAFALNIDVFLGEW